MKLSTTVEYGVRALIHLAENQADKPYPLSEIAKKEEISLPYLEKIFIRLRQAGIVIAAKGIGGGYRLAKNPKEINLKEVIEALEGSSQPYRPLVEQRKAPKLHCKSHLIFAIMQQRMLQTLSEVRLIDVVNK